MPLDEAAAVMGMEPGEVLELVRRGVLTARPPNLVRPAIVREL